MGNLIREVPVMPGWNPSIPEAEALWFKDEVRALWERLPAFVACTSAE